MTSLFRSCRMEKYQWWMGRMKTAQGRIMRAILLKVFLKRLLMLSEMPRRPFFWRTSQHQFIFLWCSFWRGQCISAQCGSVRLMGSSAACVWSKSEQIGCEWGDKNREKHIAVDQLPVHPWNTVSPSEIAFILRLGSFIPSELSNGTGSKRDYFTGRGEAGGILPWMTDWAEVPFMLLRTALFISNLINRNWQLSYNSKHNECQGIHTVFYED